MSITSKVKKRFFSRIEPITESGCWIWVGAASNSGYGCIAVKTGKTVSAHRLSYEIHKGEIPEGMVVMHACDIRTCVNPEHLSVGTHQENIIDCVSKGRKLGGRGDTHPRAKLQAVDVRNIRAIYKHIPHATHKILAGIYGVDVSTITNAINKKYWRDVPCR